MGSPEDEPHRFACEKQHRVRLTQDYLLGIEEVTVAQYRRVTSSVPTIEIDTNAAVRQISWYEADEFCRKLSELEAEKRAGRSYRLPTEAEWEYACRAGTKTAYSWGDDPAQADDYAWWLKTTKEAGAHMRVGSRKPNPWGLHDMHGGVWEWCSDWFEDFTAEEQVDPRGPVSGEDKVLKGGATNCVESYLRSATRVPYEPVFSQGYLGQTIGFRVVLIEPPADSKPAK